MLEDLYLNNRYGYVRVSFKSQESNSSIKSQKDLLIQNGIPKENIIIEIGSAADNIQNRPKFFKLIEEVLREGDKVIY